MGRQAQAATSIASKVFWNLPAWLFSAFASVSNQSAISSKPSSRAVRAIPGYMSVYSWVSPAIADFRLELVSPIGILVRSEEHTSELQSLMRISYAVFCLKKKNKTTPTQIYYKQKYSTNT